jgi:hypothetical protein
VLFTFKLPTHPFQMYNFMEASAEERSAERERQRRALAALPRTTTVSTFLANRAVALLDLQLRIEDTLLVLKNTAVAPANTPECRSVIQHLRAALPLISAEMGTHVVAARYDIESAAEALHQDEDLPGVAVPFLKAARSAYKQREEAAAKAQAELQRLQMRRRIQANAAATAITAASQAAGPCRRCFDRGRSRLRRRRLPEACRRWQQQQVPVPLRCLRRQRALESGGRVQAGGSCQLRGLAQQCTVHCGAPHHLPGTPGAPWHIRHGLNFVDGII